MQLSGCGKLCAALMFTLVTGALLGLPSPARAGEGRPDTACTVNGAAATLTVATPGQLATCSFTGKVGQQLDAALTNVTTSDNGCETLSLITPSGQTAGFQSGCGNGNPVGVGPITLTIVGTWTVQLKLDAAATGSGQLWVSAPAHTGTVTVNGPAVRLAVPHPSREPELTFHATKGQRLSLALTNVTTSDNGCETVSLITPKGQSAGYRSGCGDGNPVDLGPITVTTTGTWAVLLQLDNTATGSGRVKAST